MTDSSQNNKAPNRLTWWENLLSGCSLKDTPRLIPGLVATVMLVALAVWLTNTVNRALGFSGLISYILMVMVMGIVIRNVASVPAALVPGIDFGVRKLLRLGIICMGIGLSIFDVVRIGAWGIPIVLVCIVAGLVLTSYLSRLLRVPERLATLIAVGTGICGATAVVAAAPGIEARDEEVTYAVANITLFGVIAMVVYPFLTRWLFNGNVAMTGLFLGASIHETAQVAASGMIYDQTFGAAARVSALDVATVTKLVRNALMAIVIPAMALIYSRRNGANRAGHNPSLAREIRLFPLFILGFLLMAALRSVGDGGLRAGSAAFGIWSNQEWVTIYQAIKQFSVYLLAIAMASVGLCTSFRTMRGLGIRPFYVGFIAATLVGVAAAIMVFALGRFVQV